MEIPLLLRPVLWLLIGLALGFALGKAMARG